MRISTIKKISLIAFTLSLFACGGGDNVASPEVPTAQINTLSVMVDGIIAENVEHADHATWNLDNFDVTDDIDGDDNAEAAVNAMIDSTVDAMIAAENAQL